MLCYLKTDESTEHTLGIIWAKNLKSCLSKNDKKKWMTNGKDASDLYMQKYQCNNVSETQARTKTTLTILL